MIRTRENSPASFKYSPKRRALFAVRYLWGDEGITTQLITLIRNLKDRGWEIGLLSGVDPDEAESHANLQWLKENTEYYFVPFPSQMKVNSFFQIPWFTYKTYRVCIDFNPSIIHLFSLSLTPYFFILRAIAGIRYISRWAIEPDSSRTDVKIGGFLNKLFDTYLGEKVIAISSDMKRPLQEVLNVPEERIEVIVNGIDTSYFRPPSQAERCKARSKYGIAESEVVICIVARLDWIKGHDVLFRALRHLRDRGYEPPTLCAGTGGHEKEIRALARDLEIDDQVQFLGFTDPRTVYWASDIMVLPSRREGFANAVAEAMLCETVPIRTPTAGASDQIQHNKNGFTTPVGNHQSISNCLKLLIKYSEKMKKFKRSSTRIAVSRFSLKKNVEHIERTYIRTLT